MASKDRVILPSPAVKKLPGGNRVGCLRGSYERYASDEATTNEKGRTFDLDCLLLLRRLGTGEKKQGEYDEKRFTQ